MAEADIGCSLAEAAEADEYTGQYLAQAAQTPNRCGGGHEADGRVARM